MSQTLKSSPDTSSLPSLLSFVKIIQYGSALCHLKREEWSGCALHTFEFCSFSKLSLNSSDWLCVCGTVPYLLIWQATNYSKKIGIGSNLTKVLKTSAFLIHFTK